VGFASADVQTSEGQSLGRQYGSGPHVGLVYFDRAGHVLRYVGSASAEEVRSVLDELLAGE
jgi:hypothetical protein